MIKKTLSLFLFVPLVTMAEEIVKNNDLKIDNIDNQESDIPLVSMTLNDINIDLKEDEHNLLKSKVEYGILNQLCQMKEMKEKKMFEVVVYLENGEPYMTTMVEKDCKYLNGEKNGN